MVEEAGADQRPERRLAQLHGTAGETGGRHLLLAVRAQVVADDEGAIGPADQDGPVEAQLPDDGRDVVGPQPRVGVALGARRRLRHPVAPQVAGNQPELLKKRAGDLLVPALMALRPAVQEQDRRPVRIAPLAHVQQQPAATAHHVLFHPRV